VGDNVKAVAIVQARMGSARFPGKVMQTVGDIPLIGLLLGRLRLARSVSTIVLATSTNPREQLLCDYVSALGYAVSRGSEADVLDRYYAAAREHSADIVIRITGDCPLVDPAVVDAILARFRDGDVDYLSNVAPPTFPDGLDTEVFTFAALETAWRDARTPREREHVTPYLRESGRFRCANFTAATDGSAERWTVDEPEDLELIRKILASFTPRRDFSWEEVMELRDRHPEWFSVNRHLKRNEGAGIGTGQKLWKRAKRVIPGGNMLLSKRAEMFLPEQWPAYFSRANGCRVWDLDQREYIDMSIMGVGTNILGYGHPEVDSAVHATVTAGNMSTLNCPEEVYLAERLIELHPWADMARFSRTGGEANAVGIRIARAAAGRDRVAFCGYHGWHDWYLAANLGDGTALAGHLLPGLDPRGVPDEPRGTSVPFSFNRLDELQAIVDAHPIGAIIMEVSRSREPAPEFLRKVRELATARGIVLIFDECTSGFRQTLGGLHKLYAVEPDMAMFGKALGNGYAITATIGRREVMEAAQSSFISSTFWTERIGPTAALKTLEVMERVRSYEQITRTGEAINAGWRALAARHSLEIDISGLAALTSFSFPGPNHLAYKTLITQEMLARGYLATNTVYACIEHSPQVISGYLEALDPVLALVKSCEEGRDVTSLLKGPVCHGGFKRLN
jgi:glutamate-1-semialdehyde 2,1-aminomutase